MRRLLGFLKELRAWLVPLPTVLFVLAVLVAVVTIVWGWPSEIALRLAGLELELYGVATVVWGILETRETFELPSIWTAIPRWLRQRPRWYRPTVVQLERAAAHTSGSAITAEIAFDPATPLDQRVEVIRMQLNIITEEFRKEKESAKQKFSDLSEKLSKEQADRERADREIREMMTKQETGGLHISAMGAMAIFVGAILATIPDVILETLGHPPDGIMYVQAIP